MAQILVRNLDPATVRRLKKRAETARRSLEAEARLILEEAAHHPKLTMSEARELSRRIRRRFKGRKFSDSAELIREDRDR